MSHKLVMKTTMTDPEAIRRALIRMGIDASQIEVHAKATTCNGYSTTSQANVIVRRSYLQENFKRLGLGVGPYSTTAYGDIGFAKQADGSYEAIVDDKNVSKDWMAKLSTYYNIEKTKMELDARKITYQETTEKGLPVLLAKIPNRQHTVNHQNIVFNS